VTSAFISRLAFQEMTSSPVFSTAKNYSAAPGARNVSSWEYEITNERSSGVRGRGCWKIERTKVSVHKLRRLTRVCVVSYPVFCGGVAQVTFVYEQYRVSSGNTIFQGDRKLFFFSSRILDTGCLFLILCLYERYVNVLCIWNDKRDIVIFTSQHFNFFILLLMR